MYRNVNGNFYYEEEEDRVSRSMSLFQKIINMSEGNPGAMEILSEMINDAKMSIYILLLDTLEIRGSKLYMLYNDCSNRDYIKFENTILLIKMGKFTKEQIHFNLDQTRAIPFIDDSIKMDGMDPYSKDFKYSNDNFDIYCQKQKETFANKIELIKANQKRMTI